MVKKIYIYGKNVDSYVLFELKMYKITLECMSLILFH